MPWSKEKRSLYYQANKERFKQQHKEYYANNREKILEYQKSLGSEKKKESHRISQQKYRIKNKEKIKSNAIHSVRWWERHRVILSQVHFEERNKRAIELFKKGLALERRKVWKQLKHDYEFRYYLKIA